MADIKSKLPYNVAGKYYVDDQCIACNACVIEAPSFFTMHHDGFAYVCKQPTTEQEEKACEEAMCSCPVEAIGNNGKVAIIV